MPQKGQTGAPLRLLARSPIRGISSTPSICPASAIVNTGIHRVSGRSLTLSIRKYFIPDLSNWKSHEAFESAFARLLRDLKSNQPNPDEKTPNPH